MSIFRQSVANTLAEEPHSISGSDTADRILTEQIKLAYTQAFSGFVVTLLAAVVLVAVLWQVVGHTLLLGWLALMALITLSRYALVRSYQQTENPSERLDRWRLLLTVGAAFAGLGWGLAGTLLFPVDAVFHQIFLAFLLGGMVATALPYLVAVKPAYIAFLLTSLLPFAGLLWTQGERSYAIMGMLVLVFAAAMWAAARAINATVTRSLQSRFENVDLIQSLSAAKAALDREKKLAQLTLKSIGDGVITTDLVGTVEYINPVAERLTGWSNDEACGLPLSKVFKLVDETTGQVITDPVKPCLDEGRSFRLSEHTLLVHRDENQESSVEVAVSPIHDRELKGDGTVLVFHDVTEIRGIARRMSYQASHDSLTGLVNRQEFEFRLNGALETACNHGRHHAICYLDLDEFKVVNDTCGHIAGDELLRQLAAALQSGVRESDTLARLGGDEFGVLLEGCPLERAERVAEGLRQIVQNFRFAWEDRVFDIGISIGLVPIDADSGSFTEVMTAADAACYQAKDGGRDRIHVQELDDETVAQRHGALQWAGRIDEALKGDRIELYSQQAMPLSAKAQAHHYSEILLRMHDEEGAPIPTAAFLPAAKRYNLMPTIDRWVIRKFCSFVNDVQLCSEDRIEVFAINLSGQSLSDESFLDFVVDQLEHHGVDPRNLCFEITETAAIANLTRAMRFITVLKEKGAHFALDDFGSGLSSFAYLKNLQVDYLKIDGSFIRDTEDDPVDYAMVEIINQIGHVMDIRTIAKSVEQKSVLTKLKELGVDYAQGFEIARPAPLAEYLGHIPERRVS
ncbi:MAG: EAL domain-containing protein [Acidiferrobacterales bacterium]